MLKLVTLRPAVVYGLLACVCLILYGQTFTFQYVWDDALLFLQRTDLVNAPLSWALLAEPVLPGTTYLRPLVFLVFYAEFHIFGQSPAVSHAVNIIIFTTNVLLVAGLGAAIARTQGLARPMLVAGAAGLIYAVHPANIETAAWASGRFDLMATLFMLLAANYYVRRPPRTWSRALAVGALMLCAALSKELGVVLPAVLLALWWGLYARHHGGWVATMKACWRENSKLIAVSAGVLLAYLAIRAQTMHAMHHYSLTWDYVVRTVLLDRVPLSALALYLKLTLLPFTGIGPMHAPPDPRSWAAFGQQMLALGVMAGVAWGAWRRQLWAWLAVAYLICLGLVLHFIPMGIAGNLGQDRFLTAPLAFAALAVALVDWRAVGAKLQLRPRAAQILGLAGAGGWLVLAAAVTATTVPMWRNELLFWSWARAGDMDDPLVRYNYIQGAIANERYDLAEAEIKRVQAKFGPLQPAEQLSYATVLLARRDPDAANYQLGVIEVLPKFHEINDHAGARRFLMSPGQLASAYADYSVSLMVFKGDAAQALKYNDIALWYLSSDEQAPVLYQRKAILKALGRDVEAEEISKKLAVIKYYRSNEMEQLAANMVASFCDLAKGKPPACTIKP